MRTIKELEIIINKTEKEHGDLEYLDSNWNIANTEIKTLKDVVKLIDDEIEKFIILKNTTIGRYLFELKDKITGEK